MKLIKSLMDKFRGLSKIKKTIVVVVLIPVVLFGGIFVYATSTVLIDTIFGTDISKTVNNKEYQKEQEILKIEKEQQEKLEAENKAKEEIKQQEEQVKKEELVDKNKEESVKQISSTNEVKETKENKKNNEIKKKEDKISYDKLQQLYLDIKSDMNYEEILLKVEKSGLSFTDNEYNGSRTVKVAYEDGIALQRYADSGDSVEIHFDDEDRDGKYIFGTIEYFNNGKFVSVFEYKDGVYWDFNKGKDRGYYINNYKTTMASKEEKYIKANSKEEQLNYIKNYEDK